MRQDKDQSEWRRTHFSSDLLHVTIGTQFSHFKLMVRKHMAVSVCLPNFLIISVLTSIVLDLKQDWHFGPLVGRKEIEINDEPLPPSLQPIQLVFTLF